MTKDARDGEVVAPPQNGSNPMNRRRALPSSLLDIAEVAQWLGVEQGFVRRLIAQRRIPFVKIGKFVRFDPDEITVWIDNRRVSSEPPASGRRFSGNRP
jgi:excisionase family DNA binding protein